MLAPAALAQPTVGLVDKLAPADIRPVTMQPGQQATAPQNLQQVASAVKAANAALGWPVEKFARFCAEIDEDPTRHELIAAQYGLRGEAVEFVREGWQERLGADVSLRERWSSLVAQYRQQLGAKKLPASR